MAFGSKAFGASYFAEPSLVVVGSPGFVTGYSVGAGAAEAGTVPVGAGEGRVVHVAAGEVGDVAEAEATIGAIAAAIGEIFDEQGGYGT